MGGNDDENENSNGRAWVETAIVHLETVARVEARDHTDQPVTQVSAVMVILLIMLILLPTQP